MVVIKIFRYLNRNGILSTIEESITQISSLILFGRRDVRIGKYAKIKGLKCISIGRNFCAGRYLVLEAVQQYYKTYYSPSIVIKDNVTMHDFVHIGATNYVEVGNNVLMAGKIYISDHNHGFYSGDSQSSPLEPPDKRIVSNNDHVIIGDNVWIGEMVSILPGTCVGEGSVIGANSVVTKDIPPFSIAVGNPAKIVKRFNFETEKWEKVIK